MSEAIEMHIVDLKLANSIILNDLPGVEKALSEGTDPNYNKNKEDMAPIHLSALAGSPEIAKLLLLAGGNANLPDKNGNTPMYFAAGYGDLEKIRHFLKFGGDIAKENKSGLTPLHYAGKSGRPIPFLVLSASGASTDLIISALHLLVENNEKKKLGQIALLLLSSDIPFSIEQQKVLKKYFAKVRSHAILATLSLEEELFDIPISIKKLFNLINSGKIIKPSVHYLKTRQVNNVLKLAIRLIKEEPEQTKLAIKIVNKVRFDKKDPNFAVLLDKFACLVVQQNSDIILEDSAEYIPIV